MNKTHTVGLKPTAHMFIKLNTLQPRIEEWIKASWKAGAWSPNPCINSNGVLVHDKLREGLIPSAVTRDLKWGVPVPDIEGADNQEMLGKVFCEFRFSF